MFTGAVHKEHDLLTAVDVRIRLLLLPLLVAYAFAARDFSSLWTVALLALVLGWAAGCTAADLLRLLRGLRLLLFSILLIYLFLTPGRTLFGIGWLSLDGLLLGLLTAAQVFLGAFVALLLSRGGAEPLATGLVDLLRPLAVLGVPLVRLERLLALVFRFFPDLQRSGKSLLRSSEGEDVSGLEGRIAAWTRRLDQVLLELVDRADQEARRLAREPLGADLPRSTPWGLAETLFALPLCACWLLLIWSLL